MKTKYIIMASVVIVLVISAALIYNYYAGQSPGSGVESLHNLVDDSNYVTSLSAYPNKIISLAPSSTEILFALGLGDKVVAVTNYDDYPYNFTAWIEAKNMTSVGDFKEPNMEVIASLSPDLILVSGGVQEESIGTLRELGYKVLVLNPTTVNGVLKNIELVGNATGKNAEATALVNEIAGRVETVVNKVAEAASKPKVYYEVYYESTSSWTIGSQAWQTELIKKAGGTNIFEDQAIDYYQYQVEALINRNPDVIVLPASGMGTGGLESLDAVKARPGWDTTSAVQNDRLYRIDSNIIERAGPRVADAIEQLAVFFHPDLFK